MKEEQNRQKAQRVFFAFPACFLFNEETYRMEKLVLCSEQYSERIRF
ncbi:unknown [Clostridium sp. CAG:299]|nr:unknown [Clostridium sp. CAG:299]